MTKKDIVEKYIAGYGYKRISGQTLEPIMPVLVLDLMYQIHNEWLAEPAKQFTRKNRFHHQKWMESYKAFNRRFYGVFTVDEYDEACSLMDDFESVMANDLTIARVAVMSCFPELETDQRIVLGTISVCNTLCHIANGFWKNVLRNQDVGHRAEVGGRYHRRHDPAHLGLAEGELTWRLKKVSARAAGSRSSRVRNWSRHQRMPACMTTGIGSGTSAVSRRPETRP